MTVFLKFPPVHFVADEIDYLIWLALQKPWIDNINDDILSPENILTWAPDSQTKRCVRCLLILAR